MFPFPSPRPSPQGRGRMVGSLVVKRPPLEFLQNGHCLFPFPLARFDRRGSVAIRSPANESKFDFAWDWARFSLSPGERAGVRGNKGTLNSRKS
jgi:hypothetical protein